MANAHSTTPSLYSICPDCNRQRIIHDKRRIGKRCTQCFAKEKRNKISPGSIQQLRNGVNVSLWERVCRGCGLVSFCNKRDKNNQCRQCALKARTTHGFSAKGKEHPLYRVIKSAQARCDCPATKDYKWYGARGITVCDEWKKDPASFVYWAIANGWKRGLDLDRRDNNGNYSPENCRFITHKENCQNKSNNRLKVET